MSIAAVIPEQRAAALREIHLRRVMCRWRAIRDRKQEEFSEAGRVLRRVNRKLQAAEAAYEDHLVAAAEAEARMGARA